MRRDGTTSSKMGLIQPACSKFNSKFAFFQDFRALNANMCPEKYAFKDISKCIGELG
jgi:hypothetical protein